MPQTRITGGEWRGRVVTTPAGAAVRPTRSMVRQALFNVLAERIAGATMLDLYAGAGTVGFEALSRGAARVQFVEQRREHLQLIHATAQRFGCLERCTLTRADVLRWVRGEGDALRAADLCYLDAPYRDPAVDAVLSALGAHPPALIVCEHHRGRALPEHIGGLRRVREINHGLTALSLLQPSGDDTAQ